jgi:sterol desaturase/sphingolipid hydroxylase (fatty acid hydroxylase superfamily)
MDDLKFGKRDKRGNWEPFERVHNSPLFVPPLKPVAILKWLFGYPGYILPWNLFYALVAVAVWLWATPSLSFMRSFEPGWVAIVFARNVALVVAFYGYLHLRFYIQKAQSNLFKFNHRWLDTDNSAFLLRNQTIDNMIWTLASGVTIWTAFEVVTLWGYANGMLPYMDPARHPIAFVGLMFVIPLFRELHFYCIHRLIHWPPLYRTVHKLHHANVNPGPWSGLAMHPVEHLLYFSGVLLHWIVPSHPIHALFQLQHAGLSPAQGHTGFDKMVVGKEGSVDLHCYAHYLHHKYFEVNYADGSIPLDKWFGTFHDGSPEAEELMNRRMRERMRKLVAKRAS